MLRRRKSRISTTDNLDAEHFLKAFSAKIDGVRSSTAFAPDPLFTDLNADVGLHVFEPVDATTVLRLVNQVPNKNCELDPVPTWPVKQFSGDLSSFIARLFNASFHDGVFPTSQKCAVVTPVLKKTTLDPLDRSNYRPITNVTFMSKLLERCAHTQLYGYLQQHDLLPEQQSAYRCCHSTETAMLKVLSDVYSEADAGDVTPLSLFDLSAAFDSVDHQILIERLQRTFGVRGRALDWLPSYLSGRTQFVRYCGATSTVASLSCGVTQRSVV